MTAKKTQAPVAITLEAVSVAVAGQELLKDVNAEFKAGKVSLIVGASGAGKTVLLRALCELHDPELIQIRGKICVGGDERHRARRIGIVFQHLALFDELSSEENVRFAYDHGPAPKSRREASTPDQLIDELQVPRKTPVRALSGGQAQRLAIARTLAYDPDVIIFDEPTSGLDPVNAKIVAERVRSTCRNHEKTTVVVSHDYEQLAPIADEIFVLDPNTRSLERVDVDEFMQRAKKLPGARKLQELDAPSKASLPKRAASLVGKGFDRSGSAALATLSSIAHLIPLWKSSRWGARYFWHYLKLLASPSAWLYFMIAGFISGFVSTYFSFRFLPHSRFTEPLIADEMLQALGMVLYRVVVPVLTTVLMAARTGAAVASDVGSRSYSMQLDSLRSFGLRPSSYLLTGISFSFLIVTPLLVCASFFAAKATSLLVFVYNHPEKGADFWSRNFHHDLRVADSLAYYGTSWLIAKILICGFGVGTIAYFIAARPKSSSADVARGITGTITWATLYVLGVHLLFAFFEFETLR